jgi:hypothetical protein
MHSPEEPIPLWFILLLYAYRFFLPQGRIGKTQLDLSYRL